MSMRDDKFFGNRHGHRDGIEVNDKKNVSFELKNELNLPGWTFGMLFGIIIALVMIDISVWITGMSIRNYLADISSSIKTTEIMLARINTTLVYDTVKSDYKPGGNIASTWFTFDNTETNAFIYGFYLGKERTPGTNCVNEARNSSAKPH